VEAHRGARFLSGQTAPRRTARGFPINGDRFVDGVFEWNTYDAVRFKDENTVILKMPWGEELSVSLRPKAPVTSRAFTPSAH
jgi:hypothetical protein